MTSYRCAKRGLRPVGLMHWVCNPVGRLDSRSRQGEALSSSSSSLLLLLLLVSTHAHTPCVHRFYVRTLHTLRSLRAHVKEPMPSFPYEKAKRPEVYKQLNNAYCDMLRLLLMMLLQHSSAEHSGVSRCMQLYIDKITLITLGT